MSHTGATSHNRIDHVHNHRSVAMATHASAKMTSTRVAMQVVLKDIMMQMELSTIKVRAGMSPTMLVAPLRLRRLHRATATIMAGDRRSMRCRHHRQRHVEDEEVGEVATS